MDVKNHRRTPVDKQRENVFLYKLKNMPVCKSVFTSTLGINRSRISYLFKCKSENGLPSPDRRGRKSPSNKIDPLTEERVIQFLTLFPKYKSHYSLTSTKLYFNPSLNFDKLYTLYKESNSAEKNGERDYKSVSKTYFRNKVKDYNVSFYVPKTDSCNKCDKYHILLGTDLTNDERLNIEKNRKEHWDRAESARTMLRNMKSTASEDGSNILVFSFDLQKTQPIPFLKVNEAYYKRQLWLYNLGIHNLKDKSATMMVWTEAMGKRGSCEVGSALHDFIINQDLTMYSKIHSFSDGCGGQNKNRNIVSLMMHVVNTTPINEWTHTYLESGHSFLPNDTDFGRIERKKNSRKDICNFDEWKDVIKSCNFKVKELDVIFDLKKLSNLYTFRNFNTEGEKFSWLEVKQFKIESESSIIGYKLSNHDSEALKKIDFSSKKASGIPYSDNILEILYPDGLPITKTKYDDIMSLMYYIAPVYRGYFNALKYVGKESVQEPEVLEQSDEE